jgi:RNA polymerase sigma-70 factor (ECF subfamily)
MHCFRYLKDKQDAEEVLMDGFMKVFENLSKVEYRDENSFEAWIKRIMVNEALMFLRKKKQLIYSNEEAIEEVESKFSIANNLAAEDIYRLILSLPLGYRTIFNMFAIEGYTHKEIAQLLNITESTSRSQLTKARVLLKELLIKNNMHHEP